VDIIVILTYAVMSSGTINCGDEVVVLSGKYAGQQGKVIKITVKMYQLQLRIREVSLLKML
jgi:ribosomal protein L24